MSKKAAFTLSSKHFFSFLLLVIGSGVAFAFAYAALPTLLSVSYSGQVPLLPTIKEAVQPSVTHLPTPTPLKAIYMTQCVVGTPSLRNSLVTLVDDTELNAVVIDIKDYSGKISFPTGNASLKNSVSDECGAQDMRSFIETLHGKNIYVIGRITVFQDPYYTGVHPELAVKKLSATSTPWKDYKGLSFIDVGAQPFWDYIVTLGKESYALGFDELNFDYVRYPSDGNIQDINFTWSGGKEKSQVLEEFFRYLTSKLRPTGVVLSVDLFGYVTVHTDDLGIGQILERALPYFDYIDPMVYPSHYNSGFVGLKDVNSDPYKVVHVSLIEAVKRAEATTTTQYAFGETPIASTTPRLYEKPSYQKSKIRPWLQGFDYPVHYTPEMVQAQIQATYDTGLDSYLVWDAANKYASLRQVLATTTSRIDR